MERHTRYPLKSLNTFGVEAYADHYVRFDEPAEVTGFLRRTPLGDTPRLILGGGSNLLFTDDYAGMVLHPAFDGVAVLGDDGCHVHVRAMAGTVWDDLAAMAVEHGWGGIENLSLIPGTVGASVVQNIGAYGVEVQTCIERVETVDLSSGASVSLTAAECGFGYRRSHFKGPWEGRLLVTAVVLRLRRNPPHFVLDYPGVREAVAAQGATTLQNVRRAIIAIRQRKLPDPAVVGNAGSFFKNPVVDEKTLAALSVRYPGLPRYALGNGRFKLAAGWLIERCGWKGKALGWAAVHDRQALVLVNCGGATGREILNLAEEVAASVEHRFGIRLEAEVRAV